MEKAGYYDVLQHDSNCITHIYIEWKPWGNKNLIVLDFIYFNILYFLFFIISILYIYIFKKLFKNHFKNISEINQDNVAKEKLLKWEEHVCKRQDLPWIENKL